MVKIAVVLSGCGNMDGSEIHESTCTLLNIEKQGAQYQCFAPNINQSSVINHLSRRNEMESRGVLIESARIARGNILDLAEYRAGDFDAIIFPGGLGAAKNLCTYADKGTDCVVNFDVQNALLSSFRKIPIGAICIAPVLLAKVLGHHGITVTIGNDTDTAIDIKQTGAKHEEHNSEETCVDIENKIVTTPAYMLAKSIKEVDTGISNLIKELIRLI